MVSGLCCEFGYVFFYVALGGFAIEFRGDTDNCVVSQLLKEFFFRRAYCLSCSVTLKSL